jgi:hypothetical protein
MKKTVTRIAPLAIAAVVTLHLQLRAQQPEPGTDPPAAATEAADDAVEAGKEAAAVAEDAADPVVTDDTAVTDDAVAQEPAVTTGQEPAGSPSDIVPADKSVDADVTETTDGVEAAPDCWTPTVTVGCTAACEPTDCGGAPSKCRPKLFGRGLLRRRCR